MQTNHIPVCILLAWISHLKCENSVESSLFCYWKERQFLLFIVVVIIGFKNDSSMQLVGHNLGNCFFEFIKREPRENW